MKELSIDENFKDLHKEEVTSDLDEEPTDEAIVSSEVIVEKDPQVEQVLEDVYRKVAEECK